jgi:hypothetical protein
MAEICGAVLGKIVMNGIAAPMVCGKAKGHKESEGHTPAAPTTRTGVSSDAALKAFGAGITRPVSSPKKPLPTIPGRPKLRFRRDGAK